MCGNESYINRMAYLNQDGSVKVGILPNQVILQSHLSLDLQCEFMSPTSITLVGVVLVMV